MMSTTSSDELDVVRLGLAIMFADANSDDVRSKVGAYLDVDGQVVMGTNHFRSIPDGWTIATLNADRPMKLKHITHAEHDAIIAAGGKADGATIYVNYCPCIDCARRIIDAGVKHVVVQYRPETPSDYWYASHQEARAMFAEARVSYREVEL